MNTLPDYIKNALNNQIDFSRTFTDRVEKLKISVSNLLKLPIKHDAGMDYAPAQFISFDIVGESAAHSHKKYLFEARFYISSKASLFATYIFDKKRSVVSDDELCHPIEASRLPEAVQSVINRVREFLRGEGFREVEHHFFRLAAPGCNTQLDDLPATIFDALFSEIV